MVLQGPVLEAAPPSAAKSEILSDDQIEQLLQEAETRLRHSSEANSQAVEALDERNVIAVGSFGKRKP
jgi:hypothetical protein